MLSIEIMEYLTSNVIETENIESEWNFRQLLIKHLVPDPYWNLIVILYSYSQSKIGT